MTRPLMLDLFSGTGGASAAFRAAGWEVVTVDNDPAHRPDIVADLTTWSWPRRRPCFVWASPPCTEFTREALPWKRTGVAPSMDLVRAAIRIIKETDAAAFALENVRGAVKYIDWELGRFSYHAGPFFVWTNLQPMPVAVPPFKERLSSRDRVKRAAVPFEVSAAFLAAIQKLKWNCCGVRAEAV